MLGEAPSQQQHLPSGPVAQLGCCCQKGAVGLLLDCKNGDRSLYLFHHTTAEPVVCISHSHTHSLQLPASHTYLSHTCPRPTPRPPPCAHRVDDQLNQVEQQPSEVHQALYNLSNGPVGQATSKGVQVAAKFTMTATIQAAKAAAPVGKWALQQGFKAAVGLVGAAMEQERQSQQRKKQQQGKGSSSGTSKTKAGKNS